MSDCIVCGAPAAASSDRCASHARAQAPGAGPGRLVGRVFGGRYELGSFLGSGGFGATYVAHDTRLRRDCVVKLLHPASNPPTRLEREMRRRFSNEALALAHLVHPNVVQAIDHGEEPDGSCWIAMEYARGRPLADVIAEQRQLPVARATSIAHQVAAALAFAHARGIVHRDLKPDNVILVDSATSGETVKVLDFGIARITDPAQLGMDANEASLTQAGTFFGTPAYMSPEQAGGAPVGPESDVYALGVVLYRMLAGALPGKVPQGWNPLSTMDYVLSTPEPLRRARPDCPPALAEIVHAMLTKDARSRTLSAAQAQIELQAFLPTFAGARAVPLPRRSRARLVAGLVAAVVGLGAGAAALLTRQAPEPLPPDTAAASAAAAREAAVAGLLARAKAGAEAAVVDAAALELLKSGADARLSLARGLAHHRAGNAGRALAYLEEARALGEATPTGAEAAAAIAELRAAEEAREAAEARPAAVVPAAAPAPEPAAKAAPKPAKKAISVEDFPEY